MPFVYISLRKGKSDTYRQALIDGGLARLAAKSPFTPKAQAKRKKVEMLFAHLKRILGLGRLRLRGPCGVRDEFTLAAIAQNLRKLAKLRPKTRETRSAI